MSDISGEHVYEFREIRCETAQALLGLTTEAGGYATRLGERKPGSLEQQIARQGIENELRSVAQVAGSTVLSCINCYGNGRFALDKTECLPHNRARLRELRAKYNVWQPQARELRGENPEQ